MITWAEARNRIVVVNFTTVITGCVASFFLQSPWGSFTTIHDVWNILTDKWSVSKKKYKVQRAQKCNRKIFFPIFRGSGVQNKFLIEKKGEKYVRNIVFISRISHLLLSKSFEFWRNLKIQTPIPPPDTSLWPSLISILCIFYGQFLCCWSPFRLFSYVVLFLCLPFSCGWYFYPQPRASFFVLSYRFIDLWY